MQQKSDSQAVNTQLDRLLSSDALKSSPRTRRLLVHLVKKTLNGEEIDLQGYAIGLDVFDRPETFDPQTDSIVRVQAGRLRKLLAAYYAGEGKDDPLVIGLPKGTYVPTFLRISDTKRTRMKDYTTLAAGLIGLAILLTVLFYPSGGQQRAYDHALQMAAGPSVTVLPFMAAVDEADLEHENSRELLEALSSQGFRLLVTEKLSRFGSLRVVFAGGSSPLEPQETASSLGVDYYLTGNVRVDNNRLVMTAILALTDDGTVVWSKTFEEDTASLTALFDIETEIALGIAAALGATDSALSRDFVERASALKRLDLQHYICLLDFFEYIDRKSEEDHLRVRNCLEESTQEYPEFASGWAALSWMYGDEDRNGFNTMDESGARRALVAAKEAIKADPKSAMAHQYLSIAYFALSDDAGFRSATDMALRLNPNDPDILADAGSLLVQVDMSAQGAQMILKAMDLNPFHPPWYHGSLAMYYYLNKTTDKATYHAGRYRLEGTIMSQAIYVGALVQAGRLDEAAEVYADLIRRHPQFVDNERAMMQNWRLPPGMDKALLADLSRVSPKT